MVTFAVHILLDHGVSVLPFLSVLQTYAPYRIHSQRHRDSIYLENHAPLTTQGIKYELLNPSQSPLSLELKHGTQFPQG